ncbi:hypothetical protein GRI58_06640 [Porphyrobacter algicida]|uniref:Sulphotransferase Stf0 domain-containing protein n=1 Tax=Qipengyuania algicida TaxID=1836209 RepID=A0A845AGA8_9SPHN|nr:Stf0 family sulfotransferase [Qipengyuania algicida]MXP28497.1 hypothetical protein [Qipengyuania algicida]
MSESLTTGHERRFDFPVFTGNFWRPYLLASVPRTGSSLLAHLLWETGVLGSPLEYFNYEQQGPQGKISTPALQDELWTHLLRYRTSPNGVFGVKGFPAQFEELGKSNPTLLNKVMRFLLPGGGKARVVQLKRRDTAAHAISYARAMMSGRWRREQEELGQGVNAEYSFQAIERAGAILKSQEAAWDRMSQDLHIEPLVLWYEDLIADPEKAILAVAGYIGVDLDPAAKIVVPTIRRQSQEDALVWRKLYEASK